MWGSNVDGERLRRAGSNAPGTLPTNQWHVTGDAQPDAQRMHPPTHPTEEVEDGSSGSEDAPVDGTWGERDVGMPSQQEAMHDYDALRKNLTDLERVRSKDSQNDNQLSLKRTISARSRE